MSAPDTNVEKEEQKHKPALLGIKGAIAFAAVLLVLFVGWVIVNGQSPETPDTRIDGRTGEEVQTD
ncbi:hypothetical protein [Lutimaribacter saemankumensis]|uniref:Uncharacterized protein n=1 Tax=Lutimaribacter saemankumensis TaxID=490829 RepID=A0A1G8I9M0_9RHOB|nr:hypothetical protein [Lutimaribacter saemankumensis]SDI15557.1 hypothetical protein SAMN05421850_101826 [Lutimaribacter saemankumensis]